MMKVERAVFGSQLPVTGKNPDVKASFKETRKP
jgi:hypothetical protein